jgi:K+-sensing histidine kinase KdpD
MLFVPFLELKLKQNLKQVENFSTGMGLACSSAISGALGGDITLKKSKRGLTSFAFKIPVLQIFRPEEHNAIVRVLKEDEFLLGKDLS